MKLHLLISPLIVNVLLRRNTSSAPRVLPNGRIEPDVSCPAQRQSPIPPSIAPPVPLLPPSPQVLFIDFAGWGEAAGWTAS